MSDDLANLPGDQVQLVNEGWGINAGGSIELVAAGDSVYIAGQGDTTSVLIDASTTASIYCGPATFVLANEELLGRIALSAGPGGTVRQMAGLPDLGSFTELAPESMTLQVGLPDLGARITLLPEEITLAVGPPGGGASITLTPESITLKVAEVTLTLNPGGIFEEVAEVTRETTPEGHNLTAAETEFNIGVEGEVKEGPVKAEEVEGGAVENETLGSHTTDALKNEDAGIMLTE